MTSNHYNRVKEFMVLAGQNTPEKPVIPDENTRRLRAKLILEEAIETVYGLGFNTVIDGDVLMELIPHDQGPNLEEIVDGCCDVSVVTYGTLVACGIPDIPFIEEVDKNNLAKFGPGHTIREDGKLIKPPNHQPPKIKEILEKLN